MPREPARGNDENGDGETPGGEAEPSSKGCGLTCGSPDVPDPDPPPPPHPSHNPRVQVDGWMGQREDCQAGERTNVQAEEERMLRTPGRRAAATDSDT
ncbi:unnamed protein product [Lampetra fluviatilis]